MLTAEKISAGPLDIGGYHEGYPDYYAKPLCSLIPGEFVTSMVIEKSIYSEKERYAPRKKTS